MQQPYEQVQELVRVWLSTTATTRPNMILHPGRYTGVCLDYQLVSLRGNRPAWGVLAHRTAPEAAALIQTYGKAGKEADHDEVMDIMALWGRADLAAFILRPGGPELIMRRGEKAELQRESFAPPLSPTPPQDQAEPQEPDPLQLSPDPELPLEVLAELEQSLSPTSPLPVLPASPPAPKEPKSPVPMGLFDS